MKQRGQCLLLYASDIWVCTIIRSVTVFNRPLPSSKNPHFQNEARCTTFLVKMSFICMRMKNHFHIKGWAPTLVLKQRLGGTRKWPIVWLEVITVKPRFTNARLTRTPCNYRQFSLSLLKTFTFSLNSTRFRIRTPANGDTDTFFLPNQQILIHSQPRLCGHFIIGCALY